VISEQEEREGLKKEERHVDVDMPPILPSSYYPPFPYTSNSREW
jgi:hypothetical protein